MAEIKTISLNPNYFSEPPSRVCLVCEKLEKTGANLVYTDGAWLCDRCKSTLRKLIKDFNATSNASNALNALEQDNTDLFTKGHLHLGYAEEKEHGRD